MPQHLGLSDSVLMTSHISTRALVATAVNGTAVDMAGWDDVAFLVQAGVFGTNGTLDGLIQTSVNSGFDSTNVVNVANSNLTQIPAANANAILILEIARPTARYVRLQLTGQTNGVTAGATAMQYRRNGILPPTQVAQQVIKVQQN
jgi:hypothetical protein